MLVLYCAGARLIGFALTGQGSFFNLRLNIYLLFALYGRVSFLCVAKEKIPKERPPCRVGLRLLCALQLRAGAAELAIAQTVLALFHSKPPVLDNTKGVAVKIWLVAPEIEIQTSIAKCSSYRRRLVSRIINMSNKIDSG